MKIKKNEILNIVLNSLYVNVTFFLRAQMTNIPDITNKMTERFLERQSSVQPTALQNGTSQTTTAKNRAGKVQPNQMMHSVRLHL